jgi:tripartite-type tricarboxylate transporter receptor subunit TctC
MLRSLFLRGFLALAATCTALSAGAQADTYPSRPIKLIVPFPAGGSSDLLSRLVAERLGAELKQTIVVDNKAGGQTVIGTQAVATAPADGYTMMTVSSNAVIVGALQKVPYDLHKDLTPVIGIGAVPLLLVVPARSNIKSVADLVALSKSSPTGLSFASGGIGSLGHLAPVRFVRELKLNATHVPYRGVAPAVQDVIGGRIEFMFLSSLEGLQQVKSGGLRILGVTSAKRLPNLPDVPTLIELGFPGFTPEVWYGFLVPAKTPAAAIARLNDGVQKVLADPSVQSRLGELGLTIQVRNGAEFDKYMRAEGERWRRVVTENNIKME